MAIAAIIGSEKHADSLVVYLVNPCSDTHFFETFINSKPAPSKAKRCAGHEVDTNKASTHKWKEKGAEEDERRELADE